MFELIRLAVLAALGIALAVVSVFGLTYDHAAAPADPVPARIETPAPPKTEPVATTTPVAEPVKAPAPKPKPPAPVETAEPAPVPITEVIETIATPVTDPPAPKTLNERVRDAVVNIICVNTAGGALGSISASGVFIDPDGVILTNAHVAQYFLLENYPVPGAVTCTIRTGSPAQPKYKAQLLFLPPSWIQKNAHKIKDDAPTGNGEHDYALLQISGTLNSDIAMPAAFPYLAVSGAEITQGQTSLIAGYPAGFLGGITISKDLHQASSITLIRELYTFGTVTADIFSIGGSVVAQQGSSGGAVADVEGNLIGLIVTSTDAPDTASRDLRALATAYITRDVETESGRSLAAYLSGDTDIFGQQFRIGTAPTLSQTLINELNRN